MDNRAEKYDRLAEGFSENEYANLDYYMQRRFEIIRSWGESMKPGDSVLELGCGDGYLARILAGYGLEYSGVDLSPEMIRIAMQESKNAGLSARFKVADIGKLEITESYDVIVGFMRTFYSYIQQPNAFLQRSRPYVRKKLLIDLDPRIDLPLPQAISAIKKAGYQNVEWRPFFVPKKRRLPLSTLKLMSHCENIPWIRTLPLRWKFHCLLRCDP